MQSVAQKNAPKEAGMPVVLIVDDEPDMIELFKDTVAPAVQCRMKFARSLAEARRVLNKEPVELVITDVHLPDGNGMELLEAVQLTSPAAGTIFMTQAPSIDSTLYALRHGVFDYLPKPFSAESMQQHLKAALHRQAIAARDERRMSRLKTAVRELNKSRRTVSKKVDLLCNDLVTAYSEVAAQLHDARQAESFRKTLESAKDLEQLLCHAMDWLLKEAGYSNIAIWLNGEGNAFELGAYMKYTIAGEKKVISTLKNALLQATNRQGSLHLSDEEFQQMLSPAERKLLPAQTVMTSNCTYLGEPLAVVMLFRDGKCPFSDADAAMLRNIGSVFATLLATMVRTEERGEAASDEYNTWTDDQPKNKKKNDPDADWWKRGEPPPF